MLRTHGLRVRKIRSPGDLYSDAGLADLPDTAIAASLGCGNPTALIDLQPGQTVLDLGSGGGIDVLLPPSASGRPARSTAWT